MNDIATIPSPTLDARDLRVVLALAAAGTTARASSVLHLTQSAVSRALLAVEQKLGTKLFDRTLHGLVLTTAGHCIVEGAQPILLALGDLALRARQPARPPVRLRLVCECYTAYHWLPSALLNMRESLPGIDVDIALDYTDAAVAALEAGKIDVALLTTARTRHREIEERALFTDHVVFVLAASHPLARKHVLTRADLRTHPLFSSAPPREAAWFVTQIFGSKPPRLLHQHLPLTEATLDMARAGLGIAVLSEWIAMPHLRNGQLVAKHLDNKPLRRQWRIAWRRNVTEAALRLISALQTATPRTARGASEQAPRR